MEANDNPNYFLVSQSKSYLDENSKSYMWAPLTNKNGGSVRAYELMKQIKKGDVIIHYRNNGIPGISIAKTDAYNCKKPASIGSSADLWKEDGTKVDVEQYFSSYSIPKYKWIEFFYKNQPKYGGPIIQGGKGEYKLALAYLFSANKILVEKIIQEMENNDISKAVAAQIRIALKQPIIQTDNSISNFSIIKHSNEVKQMSLEKQNIEQIKSYISAKGFSYKENQIENLYLSLKSKPFVILAGTSGTGKSKLAKLFAESIDAEYKLVPVRPDWSDSSDLFGHLDLEGNFVPGALTEFISKANSNLNKPHILCLDEMNLARVEYYLSDFLSIIETRHSRDGRIITDSILKKESYGNDKTGAFEKYGELSLPENLYVIGTVNMDETTFPFSKKVLDRANTIEFSNVDLSFPDNFSTSEPYKLKNIENDFLKSKYLILKDCADYKVFLEKVCTNIEKLNQILVKANLHVGYRVRDEIAFYMLNNQNDDLIKENDAFDNSIMQKILPRIQGSSNAVKTMLYDLFKYCIGDNKGIQLDQDSMSDSLFDYLDNNSATYKNSAEKIAFMVRRFEEDGFTSFWL